MSKKGKRARADRRARERDLRKLVRERERLAQLEPGGSAERPLSVPTPAVIEGRAGSTPCVQCEGQLAIEEHAVSERDGQLLRKVSARCKRCRAPRTVWFRIAPDLTN